MSFKEQIANPKIAEYVLCGCLFINLYINFENKIIPINIPVDNTTKNIILKSVIALSVF